MWVLEQSNCDHTKFKYAVSHDYNAIISYINRFSNVKKYNDYFYKTKDDIYFKIYLGEELDYEKTSKKKEFNNKVIYEKEYKPIGKRNKKIS